MIEAQAVANKNKVTLIGWNPDVVDYAKHPGLTPEKMHAALEADRGALNAAGYAAHLPYIDNATTAAETVRTELQASPADCMLIGAGVRKDDDSFLVFEQLVNAVHESAPSAKICFNTNPTDTAAAVKRWL